MKASYFLIQPLLTSFWALGAFSVGMMQACTASRAWVPPKSESSFAPDFNASKCEIAFFNDFQSRVLNPHDSLSNENKALTQNERKLLFDLGIHAYARYQRESGTLQQFLQFTTFNQDEAFRNSFATWPELELVQERPVFKGGHENPDNHGKVFNLAAQRIIDQVQLGLKHIPYVCDQVRSHPESPLAKNWKTREIDENLANARDKFRNAVCSGKFIEIKRCENYARDVFEILSPHGVLREGYFEHGVLDRYISANIFDHLEFDQAVEQLISMQRQGTFNSKSDLWQTIQDAGAALTNAQKVTLLSFLTHDDIPYSPMSLLEMLAAEKNYERAALYLDFYARFENDKMVNENLVHSESLSGIEKITQKPYHFIAGLFVTCSMIEKGYSALEAGGVSLLVGGAYEAIDYTCVHAQDLAKQKNAQIEELQCRIAEKYSAGKEFKLRRMLKPDLLLSVVKENIAKAAESVHGKDLIYTEFARNHLKMIADAYQDTRAHYLGATLGMKICRSTSNNAF